MHGEIITAVYFAIDLTASEAPSLLRGIYVSIRSIVESLTNSAPQINEYYRSSGAMKDIVVPTIAALLGGALSLVGSFGATAMSNRSARINKREDEEYRRSEMAYSTVHKLLDAYNEAANLRRHINEMFEYADEKGGSELEPCAKVMAIVGHEFDLEAIRPEETSFLIKEKNAPLLNDVHLVYRRIANIVASSKEYNKLRKEMNDFIDSNITEASLEDGTRISAPLEGITRTRAEIRISTLNNLLGQIMENLDKDIPEIAKVIEEFNAAAKSRFGDKFDEFRLELG